MLARRSLGASVCLQCRLSHARQRYGPALFPPVAAAPTASFTSHARCLLSDKPPDALEYFAQDVAKSNFQSHDPFVPPIHNIFVDDGPRKPSRRKTAGGGGRRKKMKEMSAPLQSRYLGEQSEVLIIRNVSDESERRTEHVFAEDDDAESAARREEIQKALEASIAGPQAVSGQDDVNEQIDKLRPVSQEGPGYPAYVTREEFQNIRKALKDGYNVAQLRRYIVITEGMQKLRVLKREELAKERVLRRSVWQEGVTPITKRLPVAESTATPVEKLTKPKLLNRILREVWEVDVIEENEEIGEIEVQLEPWQLDLFSIQGTDTFNILDNVGHQRGVKVDSYRPGNIVRFTANKERATQAIADLEWAFQQTIALVFDLTSFEGIRERDGKQRLLDLFSQRDLDLVARLSRTIIYPKSDTILSIRGSDSRSAELAMRLLFNMLEIPSRAESRIFADPESKGILQTTSNENGLQYRDRGKNYGRWACPVPRESTRKTMPDTSSSSGETHSDQTENETETLEKTSQTAKLVEEVTNYMTSPMGGFSQPAKTSYPTKVNRNTTWGPAPLSELYINYGNVLHKPAADHSMSSISLPDLLEDSQESKRIFLNTVPGFSPFLRHVTALTQVHKTSVNVPDALLFRFIPSPWDVDGTSALEDFPDLGMRIELNKNTGSARFQGLGLTVKERNADILLPNQAVDMRITRREVLWTREILTRSEDVREYLSQISTSIDSGGNVRAPLTLKVQIPAWTVKNPERYASLPTVETEHGKEFEKMFLFTTLEHRQMIRYDFPGGKHRITFTSVEAGRLGGRRGELRLRLRKPARDPEQLKDEAPDLVSTAFGMARWIEDAVHNRLEQNAPPIRRTLSGHSSYMRLMPDGRLVEPPPPTSEKEFEDDSPGNGDGGEQTSPTGEEAPPTSGRPVGAAKSRTDSEDAPLKDGAN